MDGSSSGGGGSKVVKAGELPVAVKVVKACRGRNGNGRDKVVVVEVKIVLAVKVALTMEAAVI